MATRPTRQLLVTASTLALYFALGRLGLAIGGFHGVVAVWLPSGLAVAMILAFGRVIWPGILAGAFLVYVTTTGQIGASATIAMGNTLEAVLVAALVDRLARGTDVFRSADTTFRFVAIAAACAPVSATLAAVGAASAGVVPWTDFGFVWLAWWLASLAGMLVMTPFVVLWITTRFEWGGWLALFEAALFLGLVTSVGLIVFAGQFPSQVQNYPLEFLCVPFLLWGAFRFGRRQVATAIVLVAAIASWGTLHGFGPFARSQNDEAIVLVQAYASMMALMGVVLAAVVAEHKHAEDKLRQLATTDSLTGLVNYRRLIEVLRGEIARSQRTGRPFTVVFLDMNGLKRINDQYGHLVGSRALCRVAEVLKRSCRSIDTPSRFGGDEFAVVLPETGVEGGRKVIERVSQRLLAQADGPVISVSGGLAVFPHDGDSPTQLLRSADQSLYDARLAAGAARERTRHVEADLKTG